MAARTIAGGVFDKLGRCPRCMRLSGIATGCALVAMLAASSMGVAALAVGARLVFAAFALLTVAHLVAFLVRPPATEACRSCAERRRAWARRHFWRILKYRLRRWYRGETARTEQHGNCRTCGQKTPLEHMDEQPAAAEGLRQVVEKSPQFAQILPRLAQADPVDSWEADMLHYFVYALSPGPGDSPAHALFVARWEDDFPIAASVVTQRAGGEPEVRNLVVTMAPAAP